MTFQLTMLLALSSTMLELAGSMGCSERKLVESSRSKTPLSDLRTARRAFCLRVVDRFADVQGLAVVQVWLKSSYSRDPRCHRATPARIRFPRDFESNTSDAVLNLAAGLVVAGAPVSKYQSEGFQKLDMGISVRPRHVSCAVVEVAATVLLIADRDAVLRGE